MAGIIALSTYIPSAHLITADLSEANRRIPLFVAHGTDDDVVSPGLGRQALELVQSLGYTPEWHTYDMPHAVCEEEIADIGIWLTERLV